jgi:ArsR family transcriptional regulator
LVSRCVVHRYPSMDDASEMDGLERERRTVMTAERIAVIDTPAQCCVPIAADDMTPEEAITTASLFKALGDPHRVRVVNLLATVREAVCVCDLTDFLGLSQPTVSHHMRKLVDAGLLTREQRGVWAYYSLRPDALRRLGHVLASGRDEGGER